ncbi:MAG: sigma-70 family RNA polymerase sigma factor [Acidimicrobiia bacterium]|nr:sigma-70 family RNA polymerase sigma factor [Acidimicrobiia bacterium]
MPYQPIDDPGLLTADEEKKLARAIERGRDAAARIQSGRAERGDHDVVTDGAAARRQFFLSNLRLVLSMANAYKAPAHVDRDDMIQDGMVGLERAIEGFEWRKGYKFSTYASWWIRQAIQRGLEHTASTIRIPAHRTSELHAALREVEGDRHGLSPKLAEVAAIGAVDSLHRTLGDTTETIADVTASEAPGPDEQVAEALEREAIAELLGSLDEVTAAAIALRFGLDGGGPATYADVGSRLGLSAESVRRRVTRALAELRPRAEAALAA